LRHHPSLQPLHRYNARRYWVSRIFQPLHKLGTPAGGAVRYFHRAAGYETPTSDEKVKTVLSGIRRTIGAASTAGGRNMSPTHYGKFVAYFRVSTDRQGKSGLGLEAQRKSVLDFVDGGRWSLVAEFTEVESGKRSDRPQLAKALDACRRQKAKLVIAKLDRLSRNLAFIATLMESGVEFVAVDNPQANKLTVHILAAGAARTGDDLGAHQSRSEGRRR
jgi:predicted site-specific integrase-resolvase